MIVPDNLIVAHSIQYVANFVTCLTDIMDRLFLLA